MKVMIQVRSTSVTEAVSKAGKAYKTQVCGVLLPGSDFPVGTRMFVDQAYPVGDYEAQAEVELDRGDLKLVVGFKNMKPRTVAAAPAAAQRAA